MTRRLSNWRLMMTADDVTYAMVRAFYDCQQGRHRSDWAKYAIAAAINASGCVLVPKGDPDFPFDAAWCARRNMPWEALTDEANAASAWSVGRQEAPFCGPDGVRQWNGATLWEAMEKAKRSLGMLAAADPHEQAQDTGKEN